VHAAGPPHDVEQPVRAVVLVLLPTGPHRLKRTRFNRDIIQPLDELVGVHAGNPARIYPFCQAPAFQPLQCGAHLPDSQPGGAADSRGHEWVAGAQQDGQHTGGIYAQGDTVKGGVGRVYN